MQREPIGEFISSSLEDTKEIGLQLAQKLKNKDVVAFFGDLGSGKTTLIKTIASNISGTKEGDICSPTFNYLNIYPGSIEVYHFDLYRIKDKEHFLNMGFDEYLAKDGICLIEWAEKIIPLLPPKTTLVHILKEEDEDQRKIVLLEL
jgi:tRNA threonylcarbamoyladenosine biosynthesis protein TsaE